MWGHTLAPRQCVVIFDDTRTVVFGDAEFDRSLVSCEETRLGAQSAELYRVGIFHPELIAAMCRRASVVVATFDWRRPEMWCDLLRILDNAGMQKDARLLFTASHYNEVSAELSAATDEGCQFLRAHALERGAHIAFSADSLDLRPFVLNLLKIEPVNVEQSYFGRTVVVWEDSRERILALGPHFDIDEALKLSKSPPRAVPYRWESTNEEENNEEEETEQRTLAHLLSRELAAAGTTPSDRPVTEKHLDLSDDRQVIGEFFRKIAQRYT